MTQKLLTSVDNYITDLFVPVNPVTPDAIADREDSGLLSINLASNEFSHGALCSLPNYRLRF
jgi:hypothetical protein